MWIRAALVACLSMAVPAAAQTSISGKIGSAGLASVEAELSSLPEPTPSDALALGGVRFLRAIEKTLQTRWRVGLDARSAMLSIPIIRLPVPPNPNPDPFDPEVLEQIFAGVIDDMAAARAPLEGLDATSDASLTLDIGDLWFDVNTNGARDDGEGVFEIAGPALIRRWGALSDDERIAPTIRFDAADAEWLVAYTHLLSAVSQIVVAFDPSREVARIGEARARIAALQANAPPQNAMDMQFGAEVDLFAMIYLSLRQAPDPTRTEAARLHMLDMIAANKRFWAAVEAETDNNAEWIPNARQTSALGIDVPPETGPQWLAVLSDAEKLLSGELLVPHWRFGSGAGINLKALMQDPPAVDIVEWAQGVGLLPYVEDGPLITPDNWRQFSFLVGGDAALFVIFLN